LGAPEGDDEGPPLRRPHTVGAAVSVGMAPLRPRTGGAVGNIGMAPTDGRRFSELERMSFGRWTFLAAGARCFGPSGEMSGGGKAALGSRSSSMPALAGSTTASSGRTPAESTLATRPPSREMAAPAPAACLLDLSDEACVMEMLERMLPTGREASDPPIPTLHLPEGQVTRLSSPRSGQSSQCLSPKSACSDFNGRPDISHGAAALHCGTSGRFRQQVLARFRRQLLQRFYSLHDAFARLDHGASRDRALTPKEFHLALQRLGVGEEDADELFTAMDTNSVGGVSLSEFLHALVDVSPEALLWELRCRLVRVSIGPQNLQKALELVQWPQHGWRSKATELKRRTTRTRCRICAFCNCACRHTAEPHNGAQGEAGEDGTGAAQAAAEQTSGVHSAASPPGPGSRPARLRRHTSFHLDRGDWLKLCTSIYLTLLEAERLFTFLADDTGHVDLRAMFETLRTTVEPDVSLERFSTKVLTRYETFQHAFSAFCEDRDTDPERLLRWDGFCRIAVALSVNDGNAAKIWAVLIGADTKDAAGRTAPPTPAATMVRTAPPTPAASAAVPVTPAGTTAGSSTALRTRFRFEEGGSSPRKENRAATVTEKSFVGQLSLWYPDTALKALKSQVCERFGNLAEGQRALSRRLSRTEPLSPRELDSALRAVGIKHSDVQRALSTVTSRQGGPASLNDAIETMRGTHSAAAKVTEPVACARSTVRHETQPLWEQLRHVQSDLRRRPHDDDGGRGGSGSSIALLGPNALGDAGGSIGGGSSGLGLTRSCSQGGSESVGSSFASLTLPDTPPRALPSVLDRRRFSEAVVGAIRTAETSRSKTVLQTAHRQVMRMTDHRWAASPSRCSPSRKGSRRRRGSIRGGSQCAQLSSQEMTQISRCEMSWNMSVVDAT